MGNLMIIILLICLASYSSTEDKTDVTVTTGKPYTTKFDNIDIDDLLRNDRLLKNYVKCLEYEGPCTPDGKMLRDILPDALLTDCEKCSERQKFASEKVIHYLIDARKEYWSELEKIYDPDGAYRNKYVLSKLSTVNATIHT